MLKIKCKTNRVPHLICPYCGENKPLQDFLQLKDGPVHLILICPYCHRHVADIEQEES